MFCSDVLTVARLLLPAPRNRILSTKANETQSASNVFSSAIDDANKDSQRVAEQLVQAESEMLKLDQQLTSLQNRLSELAKNMGTLKTELYNEAAADKKKEALIKFGIKMAGAICQAVPIGQPVLGTIGKLADMAADINENGAASTSIRSSTV